MRAALTVLLGGLVALAAPEIAAASPHADAIARHGEADVAALRAELPGDANVRCALGAVYAARGNLSRASLYLEPCGDAALADDIADAVARARQSVKHALATSELSGVDVLTDPEGASAEIDALPGDRFTTPQMIWIPAGHHVVTATSPAGVTASNAIDSKPHAQGPLLIALAAPPPPQAHAGTVDMTEDNAAEDHSGPPPDLKHGQLRPSRFVDGDTEAGPHLDDPLAGGGGEARARRADAARFGVRFGGGVFDHSGADARVGFAAAAVAAVPLTERVAFAARLDWSRRGGSTDDMHGSVGDLHGSVGDIDALGATAGAAVTLARLHALDVIAGGGAHVALALGDTMDASRATLGGAAWLELPLRATPLVLGVRVEQGITSFAPGARDQAVIAELGIDLP